MQSWLTGQLCSCLTSHDYIQDYDITVTMAEVAVATVSQIHRHWHLRQEVNK